MEIVYVSKFKTGTINSNLSTVGPGAYASVLAGEGGGLVSKLDRLTDQSMVH